MTALHFAPAERNMSGWWKHLHAEASAREIEVTADPVMRWPGCTVTHVDLHEQPHYVSFQRDRPTLLIYDATTYLKGERVIDGARVRRCGPMGDTVDVVPANTRFEGIAERGSRIGCTLVTLDLEADDSPDQSWGEMAASLRPAHGLKNRMAIAVGERLREFARTGRCAWSDRHLHGATSLLLHEICAELKTGPCERRAEPPAGGLSPWSQRKVLEYLQVNLGEKVDLDALASQAGLSRFHFSRAFKKTFGAPPCHYLMQLRIRKATDLLRDTRRSITDVALDLGFATSAEFARAFRHAMSCTPREFRQRC